MKRVRVGGIRSHLVLVFLMLFTGLSVNNFLRSMEVITSTVEESVAQSLEKSLTETAASDIAKQAGSLARGAIEQLGIDSKALATALDSDIMKGALGDFSKAMETVADAPAADVTKALSTNLKTFVNKLNDALPEGSKLTETQLSAADQAINEVQNQLDATAEALQKSGLPGKQDLVPSPPTKTPTGTTPGGEPVLPQAPASAATKVEQTTINQSEKTLSKDVDKTGAGETGANKPGESSEFSAKAVATTLLSAVLFMVPQGVINSIQSKMTAKAQLQTMQAPQYFGGLWLQMPSELINQDDPQNSVFLYSQVTDPDPKKFYGNVGGTGGVVTGTIDRNNFFVPSGSGYGNCGLTAWAIAGIPTPSFAGQILHLNSGLEFMGNGDPVNDDFPFRTLTGKTDYPNNCQYTITKYLEALASKIQSGQAFQETYSDMFSGAGMITASGSFAGGDSQKNTAQLQSLAKLVYTSDTDNLLTRSYVNEGETKAATTLERLNQPFVLGAPVKRDGTTQDKISGGFQLQAIQALTEEDQQALFNTVVDPDTASSGVSPVAMGIYIYQTADTPLALGARKTLRAQGGAAADVADKVFDYVVTLEEGYAYAPAFIPVVNAPADGATSTKPGSIQWAPNPRIKYILSLLDNSLFDQAGVPVPGVSGSAIASMVSQNKMYSSALSATPSLPAVFTTMATKLTQAAQSGPFTYGGYTVTVPQELLNNNLYKTVPVYAITPGSNNNKTTLESGDTDYVVALDTNFKPVVLPSGQHKYFASLVTSTVYDNQLVPVSQPTKFSILLYTNPSTKSQTAYVATQDTVAGFLQQGAQPACDKCQNLTSPLATLYQEYSVNPYNKILAVFSELTQAISTALQNSSDPLYSGVKSAGVMPRLSNFMATNVVGSLQAVGLTPVLLESLNAQLSTDATTRNQALQTIGTAVATALTAVIKEGIAKGVVSGSLTSVATATSPAELSKLLNAATNSAVATVFANLGSDKLKEVLPDAVQVIFDSLARYLGIDAGQAYQVTLAQNGLIPVGAFYIYDSWNLAPGASSGDDSSGGGSLQPLATYFTTNSALTTLDQEIKTAHTHWKTWKLTNGQAGALAFEAMGPFAFTTKLLPNVVITATSLDDIKAGDFVYQSIAYPGDYFIVATTLAGDNAVSGSENQYTQPFDAANPQPLLISLVSGTVYQRDPATDQVTILTTNQGSPQQISNLSTVLGSLQSDALRSQLNAAAQTQQTTWPRYSYASFLLTIDPQDVQNNTYIYQDITGVTQFPPALSAIDAFFVGARKLDDGSMTVGIPLENNPDYIVNLVTGAFYGPQGLDTSTTLPAGIQPGSLLLSQLKGTVRGDMRQAIDALVQKDQAQAAAAQAKSQKKSSGGAPQQLSTAVVTKLLGSDVPYIGGGYAQLKAYNGKYYGVIGASNDTSGSTVGVITDYSAQITTGSGNKPTTAVVVYDANGTPTSVFEGVLMDIARRQVGVIVNSDGTQLLGVPNQHPGLDLKNGTLAPFSQATTATLANGSYDVQQYTDSQLPGLQVVAKYTPTGSTSPSASAAYINLFSGDQFALDGTPLVANYPVNTNSADNSSIVLLSNDPANYTAFGIGPDNYYHNFSFYKSFSSSDGTTQYTALQDVPGNSEYLAITPAQLSASNTWLVRRGQKGNSPLFAPETYTFAPQAGANAPLARAYTYIGSGDTSLVGAQGPAFQANKVTVNPNYASNNTLVAIGQLANTIFTPTQLFVPPVEKSSGDQSGIDYSALPADGYIALTPATPPAASGTSAATTQPAAGQPVVFNAPAAEDTSSTVINYPVKFYDGLVDAATGAQYIAIQDQNGVHFYIPHYQTTDAQTLQQIQQQLELYVSLAMTGDIGLFKPLPPAVNLTQVQTVVDVPTDQVDALKAFLNANTFWYDPTSQRYLYQFSQDDANALYYQADALYVDLRMGVLYDQNGIPTGSSLTYPQLQLLFNDKRIGLPTVGETYDPSSYKAPQGTTVVSLQGGNQATPSFLHYAP